MRRLAFGALAITGLALGAGCKKQEPAPPQPAAQKAAETPPAEAQAPEEDDEDESKALEPSGEEPGSIRGVVRFEGALPVPKVDPKCKRKDSIADDAVTVEGHKRLRNAYVFLENPPAGDFEPPDDPLHFEFKDCRLEPEAAVLRFEQPLDIKGNDGKQHRVPSMTEEISLQAQSKERVRHVQLHCDLHKGETAELYLSAHPFFDVTRADGSFEIRNVPDGVYKVSAAYGAFFSGGATVELKKGLPDHNLEITLRSSPMHRSASPESARQ